MILDQLYQEVTDIKNLLSQAQQQITQDKLTITDLQTKLDNSTQQLTAALDAYAKARAAAAQTMQQRILGVALTHNDMRTPYVFGAEWEHNKAFDCSSFVQYCYRVGAGIQLPRNKQYTYAGQDVPFEQLGPADLLFYDFPEGGTRDGVTDHVGMYLGNGQMIHTNTPAAGINLVDATTWNRGSLVKIWRVC